MLPPLTPADAIKPPQSIQIFPFEYTRTSPPFVNADSNDTFPPSFNINSSKNKFFRASDTELILPPSKILNSFALTSILPASPAPSFSDLVSVATNPPTISTRSPFKFTLPPGPLPSVTDVTSLSGPISRLSLPSSIKVPDPPSDFESLFTLTSPNITLSTEISMLPAGLTPLTELGHFSLLQSKLRPLSNSIHNNRPHLWSCLTPNMAILHLQLIYSQPDFSRISLGR